MMEYNHDNESDEDYADESTEYVDESADYSEESAVVDSSSNNNNNNINQDSIYVEEPEIQYVDEQDSCFLYWFLDDQHLLKVPFPSMTNSLTRTLIYWL